MCLVLITIDYYADYPRPLLGFSAVDTRIIRVYPRGRTTEFCGKSYVFRVTYRIYVHTIVEGRVMYAEPQYMR